MTFLQASAIAFGIQWVCWAVAAPLKTEKFYDLAGTGTFLVLAWRSLMSGNTFYVRQTLTTCLVTVWALRLGWFLFSRVMTYGKDRRFDGIREKPLVFLFFWTMQGVWVLVTIPPVLLLNTNKTDLALTVRDDVGWAIWAVGFVIETVADYQKSTFKANPHNAGKFIQHGLWSLCRHPNYLGEILMWTGLFVTSSTVMSGYEHLSILSPIVLALLIIHAGGIPPLESYGLKKWGDNPDYQSYLKNTAKIVPFIW